MKQKTTFMKTIVLAAVMMLGGSQAWAGDVTTLYHRALTTADGATVWGETDKDGTSENTWLGDYSNITISGSGLELKAPLKTEKTITKSISPTAGSILTFDFVWGCPYNNTYSQDGAYTNIKIGNNIEFINEKSAGSSYIINGTKTRYSGTLNDTKVRIHVVVNMATLKLTDLTITKVSDETALLEFASVPDELKTLAGETTFTQLSIGAKHTTNKNEGRYTQTVFESIKVQQETQTVATYGYTVNYKESDNIVKTVTGSLAEGVAIPVLTVLDGEGTYEGQHYLIVADAAPVQAVTSTPANNVLDVAVRKPYSTTVKVFYVVDGVKDAEAASSKEFTETDDKVAEWVYYFPYYITRDSKWYKATLKNSTDFGETGTFSTTGGTLNKEVEYTFDEQVAYFGESKWTGATGITYSNGERSSKTGNQGYTYNDIALSAGTYEMIVPGTSYSTCTVKMGDTEIGTIPQGGGSFVFEKTDDENVSFNFSGNMRQLDYFLIKKNPKTAITIGSTGWATLYTPYALDFTGTGLTAYTASCAGSTVTLTPVTNVPANTGVVLKGAAKDYDIPAVNSSSTDKGHLTGNATATTAYNAFDGYTIYALSAVNEGANVQFNPVASGNIAAAKAFLKIANTDAPAMFNVVFDNNVTGINSVHGEGFTVNGYYDLQGRKVTQPTKGLYIVKGKKVVIK